jgi:hypothetical protein
VPYQANAREKISGCDISPRLRGLIPFSELRKNYHTADLQVELLFRGINIEAREDGKVLGYTDKMNLLKAHEKDRWMAENPGSNEKMFLALHKPYFKKLSLAFFDYLELIVVE